MRIPWTIKVRGKFLALAAIFHLLFTLGLFTVGRLELAPAKIDRDGIGEFARDSRGHMAEAAALAETLRRGEFRVWLRDGRQLHTRIYSICILLLGPLIGVNILTVEPLNLLYYLGIIEATFRLGQVIAGSRAARVATLLVAFWPSVVLHSSQFLRDPLIIIALALLISQFVLLLKIRFTWPRAAISATVAALTVWVIWNARPEMWLVIFGVSCIATLAFLVRMISKRRLLLVNLVALLFLNVVPLVMPRPAVGVVSVSWSVSPQSQSTPLWGRIYAARDRFLMENHRRTGSVIDPDVVFRNPSDVIKYVPRALEVGYLAPFPSMWLRKGYNTGLAGRLLGGLEMTATYLLEILALIYVWRTRRRAATWFVVLTTLVGMLALGLVVVNVGTIYRMRYPFWLPIVVMGTATLVRLNLPKRLVWMR